MLLLPAFSAGAAVYQGKVVDTKGQPISYATVYPADDPVSGTATGTDGTFRFQTTASPNSAVVVSFIGYEKQVIMLNRLTATDPLTTIVLSEQPLALEETVIAAKASKQRNKRKQMATLLHQVYVQMSKDFTNQPARYHVVSDVRMDSEGEAWGMEQMIASIVVLPEGAKSGKDSVQFAGEHCKRYFQQDKRNLADTILAGDGLDRMNKDMRRAVNAIDSGVVVHKSLFAAGNIRYDFEQTSEDKLRRWSVSNESEGETVLTHIEKHNYLGIFVLQMTRNYILDSETLSVRRFSERADIKISIPFGMKLNADQLQLLNLLNRGDEEIEKFRLRKATATVSLNTFYQRKDGHLYTLEKNLRTDALLTGTKKAEIPVLVNATQRVVSLETSNVKPMTSRQMTRRVKREIVEIY
ncbi:MAG: carboxypeptidase-like regulatory domain-containing protein [Paludibacteraceae bacterium]|nr:carboxypeptidase-like regulatory domain-containing protein [Paludibacteraceae bacterium]